MASRAVLVMASYLDKKGLANVRGMYTDLDTSNANVDRMVRNYGSVNPRASVVGLFGLGSVAIQFTPASVKKPPRICVAPSQDVRYHELACS